MTPDEKLMRLHDDLETIAMYYKRYLEPVDLSCLTKDNVLDTWIRANGIYRLFVRKTQDISFVPDEMMPSFAHLASILNNRLGHYKEESRLAFIEMYGTEPIEAKD